MLRPWPQSKLITPAVQPDVKHLPKHQRVKGTKGKWAGRHYRFTSLCSNVWTNGGANLQLLRNSCPALCLLQGAGVELDPGEAGVTEYREKQHLQTQSPPRQGQPGNADKERTHYPHITDTPKHWLAQPLFPELLQKANIRCCRALLQLKARGGSCLLGTSLSLSGTVTRRLHNAPLSSSSHRFYPVGHSLTFRASLLLSHQPSKSHVEQQAQLQQSLDCERRLHGCRGFICAELSGTFARRMVTVHQYSWGTIMLWNIYEAGKARCCHRFLQSVFFFFFTNTHIFSHVKRLSRD